MLIVGALNTFVAKGKPTDGMAHMIGQTIGVHRCYPAHDVFGK